MSKLIALLMVSVLLSGCWMCPVCPPTTICPSPPKPTLLEKPVLESLSLKKGDPEATVLKALQDDLGACLRYSDQQQEQLNKYK